MYELEQIGEKTFYIHCPAKIGVYINHTNQAYLIDSGNDKEVGKKIIKILEQKGWNLVAIINTHSNADHIGANAYLQEKTGCKVISTKLENAFSEFPILEPSFLYGGYPLREMQNKFLLAKPSKNTQTIEEGLPEGLSFFRLPGHFFDMIGIRTSDDICFLADCLSGEAILEKYHLVFIYDVEKYLQTLDEVEKLEARFFVPAHAEVTTDIRPIVEKNRKKIQEVIQTIKTICNTPKNVEQILKEVMDYYGLTLDYNQYVLVGSTLRSYLSYLHNIGEIETNLLDNQLLWNSKKG